MEGGGGGGDDEDGNTAEKTQEDATKNPSHSSQSGNSDFDSGNTRTLNTEKIQNNASKNPSHSSQSGNSGHDIGNTSNQRTLNLSQDNATKNPSHSSQSGNSDHGSGITRTLSTDKTQDIATKNPSHSSKSGNSGHDIGNTSNQRTLNLSQDNATKNPLHSSQFGNSGYDSGNTRTLKFTDEPTQSNQHRNIGVKSSYADNHGTHELAESPSQSHQHGDKDDSVIITNKSSTHKLSNTSKTDNPNSQGISVIPSTLIPSQSHLGTEPQLSNTSKTDNPNTQGISVIPSTLTSPSHLGTEPQLSNTSKTDNPNTQGISVIPSQSHHGTGQQTVSMPARDALKALIKIKIEEKAAHRQSDDETVDDDGYRGALVIHENPSTSDDFNSSQEYHEESMDWSHDEDAGSSRSCDDSTSPGKDRYVLKKEKHRYAARRYRHKEMWMRDKLQRDEKALTDANAKLAAREKELEAIKTECLEELKNLDKHILCKGLSALADVVPPGLEDAVVSVKMVLYREIAGQIKELAHFVNRDQIVPEVGRTAAELAASIGIHPQDLVLVPPTASSSSSITSAGDPREKIIITCRPVNEESATTPPSASDRPVIETIPGIIYAGEGTIMVASMNPSHREALSDASKRVLPQATVNPLNIGNPVTRATLNPLIGNQPTAVPHVGNQSHQQNIQTPLHMGKQNNMSTLLHAGNYSAGSALHPGTSGIELGNQHPVAQQAAMLHTGKQLSIAAPVGAEYVAAPSTVYVAAPGTEYVTTPPRTEYVAAPGTEYVTPPRTEYVAAPSTEYVTPPRTEYDAAPSTEYVTPPRTDYVAAPSTEYVTPPRTDYVEAPSPNPTPIATNLHSNYSPKERPMPVLEQSAPIDLSKSTGLKEAKKYDKVEDKTDDIQVQEVSQSSSANDDLSSAAMALIDLSNAHALIDLSKTGAMRRLDLAPVERDAASRNELQTVVPEASNTGDMALDYSQNQPYKQTSSTYHVDPTQIETPYVRPVMISSPPPKQTSPLDLSKSGSQDSIVQETSTQNTRDSSKPVIVFVQSLATGMGELPRIDLNQTKPSLPVTSNQSLPVTSNQSSIQSSDQVNIQATQSSHSIHEPSQDGHNTTTSQVSSRKASDTSYSSEQPSTSGHSPHSPDPSSSPEPCQLSSPVKLLHKTLLSTARAPIQPLIGITRKERQRYASKKNRQKNMLIKKALLQDQEHLKTANKKLNDIIQDLESIKSTCLAQLANSNPHLPRQLRAHSTTKQEAQSYWDKKLKVAMKLQVPLVNESPMCISADVPFTALCSDAQMWSKPIDPKFLNSVLMNVKLGKLEWCGTLLSEGRILEYNDREDMADDKMEVPDAMQMVLVKSDERMDIGGAYREEPSGGLHGEKPSVPLDELQLRQLRVDQEAVGEDMEIDDSSTVPLGLGAQLLLQFKASVEAQKHGQK